MPTMANAAKRSVSPQQEDVKIFCGIAELGIRRQCRLEAVKRIDGLLEKCRFMVPAPDLLTTVEEVERAVLVLWVGLVCS